MALFILIIFHLLINVPLGHGQGCDTTLSSRSGVVQSPGHPSTYPTDIECSLRIEAEPGSVIELSLEKFDLEESTDCLNAHLAVHDGPEAVSPVLLPPSCGRRIAWPSHPTTLLTSGRTMTIIFRTSMSTRYNETGFRATYSQVPPREEFFLAVDANNRRIFKQNRLGVNFDIVGVVGLLRPVAIDYDPVEQKIYFTDVVTKHISRSDLDGRNQETVATALVDVPDGLAVDPVSRLLYWTDAGAQPMLSVSRLDGSFRRILTQESIESPRDIVIDTQRRNIYWSDWGTVAKIERARGDLTERRLIASTGLGWPNGLALDSSGEKLYWADARLNRIERSNLDGTSREVLKQFSEDIHPFGLIFRENTLYWTDWVTGGVDVADSNLQENPTTLLVADEPTRFHGLAFFSSGDPSIVQHDCSLDGLNSGCMELCVNLPDRASCLSVAPTFDQCPEDIVVISSRVEEVVWREPIATSPSDIDVNIVESHPGSSLSVSPNDGTIPVTYTATDILGNTAQCKFNIIVTFDATPPVVSYCPPDISRGIPPTEDTVAISWDEPEVEDDSGIVNLVGQSRHSGDIFSRGQTTVRYIYEDVAGNQAICEFRVEIIERKDVTPPVVTYCPSDITQEKPPAARIVWREPEAEDDSGTVNLIRQSHSSGDNFRSGQTTVSYTFEDLAGNEAICEFRVNIIERIATTTQSTHAAEEPEPGNAPGPDMLVISISAGAGVLVIVVIISFILGKYVMCRCRVCENDQPVDHAVFANHAFVEPGAKLPQHPALPTMPSHIYNTRIGSTPPSSLPPPQGHYGRESSRIYQEVTEDPPVYSHNLPPDHQSFYSTGITNHSYLKDESVDTRPPMAVPRGRHGGTAPSLPANPADRRAPDGNALGRDSRRLDGNGYLMIDEQQLRASSPYMSMHGDTPQNAE